MQSHDDLAPPTAKNLRRVIAVVALLNMAYFGVEFSVAIAIGSVSLFADSVDFFEDVSVNLLIFTALTWSGAHRAQPGWLSRGFYCCRHSLSSGRFGVNSTYPFHRRPFH